ncbi:MAG: hypothetical protein PUB94_01590 [Oscillospiraceae bacterium]|nr:hypothetical protein [Oscillospiraceae bacterium]
MAFSSVDSLRLRLKAQPFELGAYLKTPQSWRAGGAKASSQAKKGAAAPRRFLSENLLPLPSAGQRNTD